MMGFSNAVRTSYIMEYNTPINTAMKRGIGIKVYMSRRISTDAQKLPTVESCESLKEKLANKRMAKTRIYTAEV